MPPDKLEHDDLAFFSLQEREWIDKMAAINGRTPVEEVRSLIRLRACGHMKYLGDDRGSFRVCEDGYLDGAHAESVEIGI